MLENGSDESVVRWGNDGDSFVVLEVCASGLQYRGRLADPGTEREIYKAHPSQALQTQQFRQFCPPAEQV